MVKTVTFTFSSAAYEGTEATETFTFEELGIEENMDEKALGREMERIFQAWVWHKLNISSSVYIRDGEKAYKEIVTGNSHDELRTLGKVIKEQYINEGLSHVANTEK